MDAIINELAEAVVGAYTKQGGNKLDGAHVASYDASPDGVLIVLDDGRKFMLKVNAK